MKCIICGRDFSPKNSRQKTCGMACRMEKQRRYSAGYYRMINPLEERTCEGCGKKFMPKRKNGKYCVPECRGMNRKKGKEDTVQQSGGRQSHTRHPRGQQSGKGKTIREINRMAREQGLTYGKLVEKMYAEQARIGR